MSTEFPSEGNRLGTLGAPKPLGSLVQSARGKQLNQVRWFFIVIGLAMSLFYGIELAKIWEINKNAVQANIQKKPVPGQADFATQIRVATALTVSMIFVGVCFLVLGLMIRKFPVAATLIGLILYIAQTGLLFYLNGASGIVAGGIVRVFIIIGLIRSLQSAIALQSENRQTAELASPLS